MSALRIASCLVALAVTAGAWATPSATRRSDPRVHEIRMIGDATGYRFEPSKISIASGDSVVFRVVSGQPHTVAFDTTAIPAPVARTLGARMRDKIGTMSGPLLLSAGDRYAISFAGMPSGRYPFFCLPHLALRMTGEVVVR